MSSMTFLMATWLDRFEFHLKSFVGNSSKDRKGKNVRETNFACPLLISSTKTQINGTYMILKQKSKELQTQGQEDQGQNEVCKRSGQFTKHRCFTVTMENTKGDRQAQSGHS